MELRGREALASRRHVLDGVRGVAGLADVEPVREPLMAAWQKYRQSNRTVDRERADSNHLFMQEKTFQ